MRPDREDVAAQRTAVHAARADLRDALAEVSLEAAFAARTAGSAAKHPPPIDLDRYIAAHRRVLAAEQALDLAVYDLRTASGEDG